MNIAIIFAGGSGTRMGADVPKQFLEISRLIGTALCCHLDTFGVRIVALVRDKEKAVGLGSLIKGMT